MHVPWWFSFPYGSTGKESTCNVGDLGSISGLGRSPGEGKGHTLQYSGLENSMDCIVSGVTKSWTPLSSFHFHFLWWFSGEDPTCQWRSCRGHRFHPWVWKIPWRRAWQPAPVFLPGDSHGRGTELDSTEWFSVLVQQYLSPSYMLGAYSCACECRNLQVDLVFLIKVGEGLGCSLCVSKLAALLVHCLPNLHSHDRCNPETSLRPGLPSLYLHHRRRFRSLCWTPCGGGCERYLGPTFCFQRKWNVNHRSTSPYLKPLGQDTFWNLGRVCCLKRW